jgi:hypothetical protein
MTPPERLGRDLADARRRGEPFAEAWTVALPAKPAGSSRFAQEWSGLPGAQCRGGRKVARGDNGARPAAGSRGPDFGQVRLLSAVVAPTKLLEPADPEPGSFERIDDGSPFGGEFTHDARQEHGLRGRPRPELVVGEMRSSSSEVNGQRHESQDGWTSGGTVGFLPARRHEPQQESRSTGRPLVLLKGSSQSGICTTSPFLFVGSGSNGHDRSVSCERGGCRSRLDTAAGSASMGQRR